jgi:hypothetical protein
MNSRYNLLQCEGIIPARPFRAVFLEGRTMTRLTRSIAATALGLLFAGAAMADTLELKDGRVLTGRFLGGTQALMRFSATSAASSAGSSRRCTGPSASGKSDRDSCRAKLADTHD